MMSLIAICILRTRPLGPILVLCWLLRILVPQSRKGLLLSMIKIVPLMPITTNNESTPFRPTATASHQLPSNWPQSNKHPLQHPSKPTKTTTTAITRASSISTIVTSNKYLMVSLTHIIVYKQVQTVHLLLLL